MKTVRKRVLELDGKNKAKIVEVDFQKLQSTSADKGKYYTVLSLGAQLGVTIALPIVGGIILGKYLDTKLGTSPKLTLSLLFLGILIGVTGIYQIIKEST